MQVVDKKMFLAGFDLNEDSTSSSPGVFNATLGTNHTAGILHSVELMGLQCGKECYSISIAAALTFLAGTYQVKEQLYYCPKALLYEIKHCIFELKVP